MEYAGELFTFPKFNNVIATVFLGKENPGIHNEEDNLVQQS